MPKDRTPDPRELAAQLHAAVGDQPVLLRVGRAHPDLDLRTGDLFVLGDDMRLRAIVRLLDPGAAAEYDRAFLGALREHGGKQ